MRLTIITHDHPWPTIHGGRVDMWSRLMELRRRGCAVQLLSWGTPPPTAEDRAVMEAVTDDIQFFSPRKDIGRFLDPHFPGTVRNRMWNSCALKDILASAVRFGPDAVVADGSMVGGAALQLVNAWQRPIPFLVRSHNIEFEHCRMLGRNESRLLTRLAYGVEAMRYGRFERSLLQRADHVFHASYDDFRYWDSVRFANQSWLPPIITWPQSGTPSTIKPFDVVYLGNLGSAHKLASLLWFLRKIRPLLPPSLRVAIGGADPPPHFAAVCREHHCEYVGNVESAAKFLAQGKVLINPVRESCGLNIKMAEMLYARVPIVSTPEGIRGHPENIRRWIHVATTPEEYACAIGLALEEPPLDEAVICWLQQTFGTQTLDLFVNQAETIIRDFARKTS
jgi:hypothetical protein